MDDNNKLYAKLIRSTLPARKYTLIQGKIKKIIQSNQDVGKLASSIPHLMCTSNSMIEHSLQIFLSSVLDEVNDIAA